jgi:hypothetical protein
MKTKFVLASVVAALSGLAGFTTTASAGTDVHLSINLGAPRPVIVVPSRDHRGHGYNDDHRHGPRGYWKEIEVRTWVPSRWVVTYDRRGREVRTLHKGHYAIRTDRVWVAYDGRGRGGDYRRG